MKVEKKTVITAGLVMICSFIHFYSRYPMRVENDYSNHFFPRFSHWLRFLLGKFPVSIGDIFYGLLIFWLIWKTICYTRVLFKKNSTVSKKYILRSLGYKILNFCCIMYIIFNIFWGINYDRQGIAWQLGLKMEKYSDEDLKEINGLLVDKINEAKKRLLATETAYPSNKNLFGMVSSAYENVSLQYPFLKYKPPSLKSSMWGWLGNYTGFTGYYNPFTGEAQLNTTVPKFLQPFIASHEVAHQLGYAKEMEANFVGYLAASSSVEPLLHYSVYLDIFIYSNRNLFYTDSTSAKLYRTALDTAVVEDLKEWSAFQKKHQSIVEPIVRWIYGKYLQGNKQPHGILSYDEVTAFVISYYKKFGKI